MATEVSGLLCAAVLVQDVPLLAAGGEVVHWRHSQADEPEEEAEASSGAGGEGHSGLPRPASTASLLSKSSAASLLPALPASSVSLRKNDPKAGDPFLSMARHMTMNYPLDPSAFAALGDDPEEEDDEEAEAAAAAAAAEAAAAAAEGGVITSEPCALRGSVRSLGASVRYHP